jgi:hypothetical protein
MEAIKAQKNRTDSKGIDGRFHWRDLVKRYFRNLQVSQIVARGNKAPNGSILKITQKCKKLQL